MKRKSKILKKIALSATLSTLMLLAIPASALAAENDAGSTLAYGSEEADYDATYAEENAVVTEDGEAAAEVENTELSEDTTHEDRAESGAGADGSEENEENFFSAVYNKIMSHAGDIFSTLAFLGSLLIALAYKKGLLPALTKAISGIKDSIEKVQRSANEGNSAASEGYSKLAEKLSKLEDTLSVFCNSVMNIGERLDTLGGDAADREKMQIIMSSQIDMLYDVFMSSSLPQYQKEAIGSRVVKMKEELSKNE